MIEFCMGKRMFLAIGILGGLTILVLVIESHWASTSVYSTPTSVPGKNSTCWLSEEYQVLEPCHPCTDFEISSKSFKECIPTKYKEVLQCLLSGKVIRGCDKVVWLEERKFWTFEAVTFNGAVLSLLAAYVRQKQLDRQMLRRLRRELVPSAKQTC